MKETGPLLISVDRTLGLPLDWPLDLPLDLSIKSQTGRPVSAFVCSTVFRFHSVACGLLGGPVLSVGPVLLSRQGSFPASFLPVIRRSSFSFRA